jgi:hypothetical protein
VACAAVAGEVGGAGLRLGEMIGAPMFVLGVASAGGGIDGVLFAVGLAGAGRAIGALTVALSPALVSTIGDIGADCQSSPKSTLPSAITSTAP